MWRVTPSGSTVSVDGQGEFRLVGYDGVGVNLVVYSTGGMARPVEVVFPQPGLINGIRASQGLEPLDANSRAGLARLAALKAVDRDPSFFEDSDPLRLGLDTDGISEVTAGRPISDQSLRRYLARRLYLAWEMGSFDDWVEFDDTDLALTGTDARGLLRNLQLLAGEEYAQLDRTHDPGLAGFTARGTTKLVREVERYGAAREDVETEADYVQAIRNMPALSPDTASIVHERRRFEEAQSTAEMVSVFRGVVPIVEGVVRRLLRANGCDRQLTTLGSMIGELKTRGLGGQGLWSQLNAILHNARDISLHGEGLPVSVLRIATETCFELLPQLGQLFPHPSAEGEVTSTR